MPHGNDEYERAAEFFNQLYNEAFDAIEVGPGLVFFASIEDVPQEIMDAVVEDLLE